MVVLGHLFELGMLHHLQHPETDGQDRKDRHHQVLERREPGAHTAAIFDNWSHKSLRMADGGWRSSIRHPLQSACRPQIHIPQSAMRLVIVSAAVSQPVAPPSLPGE